MVKLYLATLRQDAAQIIIRHHPLCHRHDKQSLEVIHSARWAPSLLHEIHYPATARLCVATSANVVVYRVSRHGNHSVSVSHGVGIAVTHPNLASVLKLQEQRQQQMENYKNDVEEESAILEANKNNSGVDNTRHNKRSRKQETCSRSINKQSRRDVQKSNAKELKAATQQTNQRKNVRQHRQQKRQTAQRQRRQVKIDSDSESDGDESEYSTSSSFELSSESSSSDNKTSVKTKSTTSEQENQIRFTLIDYHWLDYEQLLIVTNAGVHVVSLCNNFSDEESEQILTLPQEPHYTFVHDTFGVHALFIACTCLCKIDNIGHEGNSCNGSRCTYLLLLASPFVIRVLLVTSHDPLEMCKLNSSCIYDNSISNSEDNDARSVTVNIIGLHYVEIQTMNSVPASLCCYINDDNDDDGYRNITDWSQPSSKYIDAHHKEEKQEECVQLLNEVSSTKEQLQEYVMKVGVIISSPNETIRGTFEVRINSNMFASTMLRNVAPLEHSKERLQSIEECNRQHTLITSEWRLNARFDLSLLANETALRSLHLVDLSSVQLPLAQELAKHNLSGKTSEPLSLSSRYFMIGLTRHYVFGFTSRGMQPILLFQCPSLASAFEMPLHSALAVSGIAIHASCTLALLLLQNGQVNSVSMFIKPNCVNDTNGLLNRMLYLCGMNSSHEKNANTINYAQRDYRKGVVNTTRTPVTTVNNNNNSNSTSLSQSLSYSLSQHNSLQRALWERQRSYSFFIWEQLFASDAECVSLRLYSEEYKKLMHYGSSNANNENTKNNDKGSCTLSRNVLSCHYSSTEALCKRYLELRDEYSVDLYLRYVMPSNEEAFTRCLYKRHNCLPITSTSQCYRATSNNDFIVNNVEH